MRIPILTAVSDARWEAALVQAFETTDLGIVLVRRCVDLADLLATAAAGTARAVLVSSDLRRLDRDALSRLASARIAVVALVPPGDEDAERRLRQLGLTHIVAADAPAQVVSEHLVAAVDGMGSAGGAGGAARPGALTDPAAALPDLTPYDDDLLLDAAPPLAELAGQVIAVWGPTGAPGRTVVAAALACELADAGAQTLLVDADVYGGAIAQALGLLDEAPGVAAAARLANNGTLDVPALAGLARSISPRLRVLTGITRAERWTELRPAAMEALLVQARVLAQHIVVDVGFCLEEDEELSFDTTAPRRNGATLAVLADADVVVAVGSADPVSLQRLVRGLSRLAEAVPGVAPVVVVNRIRRTLLAGDPEREISAALERYAGVVPSAFIPFDLKAFDAALMSGRSLLEVAADSPARTAVAGLASRLASTTAVVRTRS